MCLLEGLHAGVEQREAGSEGGSPLPPRSLTSAPPTVVLSPRQVMMQMHKFRKARGMVVERSTPRATRVAGLKTGLLGSRGAPQLRGEAPGTQQAVSTPLRSSISPHGPPASGPSGHVSLVSQLTPGLPPLSFRHPPLPFAEQASQAPRKPPGAPRRQRSSRSSLVPLSQEALSSHAKMQRALRRELIQMRKTG